MGDPQRDDASTIRRHLMRLLTEPQFLERLQLLQDAYEAYATERVLEHEVDALLKA